jgi:hypothetical protein
MDKIEFISFNIKYIMEHEIVNDILNEEIIRLTIENDKLKQEIKQTRVTKNLEIDEVDALYNKTKEELAIANKKIQELKLESLSNYKNFNFASELLNIMEFKKTPEFKEFKEDFIKYGIPYLKNEPDKWVNYYSINNYFYQKIKIKYEGVINKYLLLSETLNKLSLCTGKVVYKSDVIFNIYILEFIFEINIDIKNVSN